MCSTIDIYSYYNLFLFEDIHFRKFDLINSLYYEKKNIRNTKWASTHYQHFSEKESSGKTVMTIYL